MKWKNLSNRDVGKIVNKLDLQLKNNNGPHPIYTFEYGDKKMLQVKLPNKHGSKGFSTGFIKAIMNSLELRTREFERLVDCPLTKEKFVELLLERTEND